MPKPSPVNRKATARSTAAAIKTPSLSAANILGEQLASFRKLQAFSLEQVATHAGITKSYLSKLERGLSSPTIATLLKLAKALGASCEQLIGSATQNNEIVLTKAPDRVLFSRSTEREGYTYEAIAACRAKKIMMPFVMIPPSIIDAKENLVSHPGEELIFLISGKIEVIFQDRIVKLNAGDSVYFNASIPHRSRSLGKTPAQALVVVTDPIQYHDLNIS